MKQILKKMLLFFVLASVSLAFAQETQQENSAPSPAVTEISSAAQSDTQQNAQSSSQPNATASSKPTLGESIVSEQGHRFIELKGAIPVHPYLTTHGAVQSTVVAFSETLGTVLSLGTEHSSIKPKLSTDLNFTIFPPVGMSQLGFIGGVAFDMWKYPDKGGSNGGRKTYSMNFVYGGLHGEYFHYVFNEIGTRISFYGDLTIGWLLSNDDSDSKNIFCFDIGLFGVQFCPEKHIGMYFELFHLGARPFMQTGVSIGL